ncbi:MAG: hypothetical protein ACTHLF_12080 [Luteibacter sp.]
MSRRPRGLIGLPLCMAACVLSGLLLALLAGPAWQFAACALLAVPVVALVVLVLRSP